MAALFEKLFSKYARAAADIADYLADATIDLYKEDVPLSEATVVADLTAVIANYSGYAQGTIVWQNPTISDDGQVECVGTCAVFRPTSSVVTNNIVGCFIRKDTTGELLFFGPLDGQPINMHSVFHSITVIVRYRPDTESLTVVVS